MFGTFTVSIPEVPELVPTRVPEFHRLSVKLLSPE